MKTTIQITIVNDKGETSERGFFNLRDAIIYLEYKEKFHKL